MTREQKRNAWALAIGGPLIVAVVIGAARHEVSQDMRHAHQDSTLTSHTLRLESLESGQRRLDSANAANVKRILRVICFRNPHPACDQ